MSALELAQQVFDVGRRALGIEHPQVIHAMVNLATILDAFGRFDEARPKYESAISSLRKVDADSPDLAQVLANLAVGYASVLDYAAAVPLAGEAADIRRRLWGSDDSRTRRAVQMLAGLYGAMGEFDRAAEIFPEPVTQPTGREIPPSLALVLTNEARRFESEGKTAAARALYERAVEAARRTFGDDHPLVPVSLNNLGLIVQAEGDLAAADEVFSAALQGLESGARQSLERGAQSELIAQVLTNRGWVRVLDGRYAEAEDDLQRARALLDAQQTTTPLSADVLNNLGMLRHITGDPASAVDLVEAAAATARTIAPDDARRVADMENNLGAIYRAMGRHEEAQRCYLNALAARAEAFGPRHPDVAQSLNNLSALWLASGDLDQAVEVATAAVNVRAEVLGPSHPDTAQSMNNLAAIEQARGHHDEALAMALASAGVFRESRGAQHPDLVVPLLNATISMIELGRHAEALQTLLEAARTENLLISSVLPVATEDQRRQVVNRADITLQVALHMLLSTTDLGVNAVNEVLDIVLLRKGLVVEAVAAQRELALAEEDPDLVAPLEQLIQLRRRIAAQLLSGNRGGSVDDTTELTGQLRAAERRVARSVPLVALAQRMQRANVVELSAALPPDAILVEVLRTQPARLGGWVAEPDRYVAFVVHPGAGLEVEFVVLGDADHIDRLIGSYLTALLNPFGGDGMGGREIGAELRAAVLDPLSRRPHRRTRILIAADGELARLPFDVLPLGDGYVIDELEISYLPTGRHLLRFSEPYSPPKSEPLVVADPDFDHRARVSEAITVETSESHDLRGAIGSFGPLPGTRIEGDYIASLLGVPALTGAAATDSAVRSARAPGVLHLATHGYFLPNPALDTADLRTRDMDANRLVLLARAADPLLRSGLALAGVNPWLAGLSSDAQVEDGLLTALDVCGMDLLGTQLVVLSACNTGLGDVRNGEGVEGLRRAFMEAGARTVLMSLWEVPDEETMQLMTGLYDRLIAGQDSGSALRDARLAIRELQPHPYFWGAFVLLGNPDRVSWNGSLASGRPTGAP